ncbi:MAG TPA: NYN domain-containing protein [Candidatus Limnocylindria bacterium]|nr:NYN domain-containing protein [Candidatus Limnocylindria bacterium]
MSLALRNIAYVDGQNLYMGTTKNSPKWTVNLARFRIYLTRKYNVEDAYYYLGYVQEGANIEKLYESIQKAGFILVFREHNSAMLGKKKGNVDADIIFSIMKRLYLKEKFNRVVLVSGDGDYKMLVDFLIEQNKFEKILFPNRRYRSSLYKSIDIKYFAYLDDADIKRKIKQ